MLLGLVAAATPVLARPVVLRTGSDFGLGAGAHLAQGGVAVGFNGDAIETSAGRVLAQIPGQDPLTDSRLVFLGPDEQGELLEVMAIETETGGLLVIHAQPIRNRYLELLEGGL